MGASRPWPEVMKKLTGTDKMSAGSLLEYFKPLFEWLKEENSKEEGKAPGWDESCPQFNAGVTLSSATAVALAVATALIGSLW